MKKLVRFMICLWVLSMCIVPIEAKKKYVYLTFDDGPSQRTPEILKILNQYKVKATFFVTGNGGKKYNKYIGQAFRKGHAIAAHSYTHKYSIYKSEKTYFDDLGKIQKLIKKQTGMTTRLIRFPGGSSNVVSRKYKKGIMTKLTKSVLKKGYQYYDWNVDSTDAEGNHRPVDKLVKYATTTKPTHAVILMHDVGAKKTTVKALPDIIKYYKKHHYTFRVLTKDSCVCHHHINN